jgi:hypothetical protein
MNVRAHSNLAVRYVRLPFHMQSETHESITRSSSTILLSDIDARPSSRLRHIDVHYSHEKNFLINQAWLTTHQNNDFKKSTLRLTIRRARNVIQFCSNNVQTISIRNTSASKQGMMNHWKMLTHRMMMPFATFVSSTDS